MSWVGNNETGFYNDDTDYDEAVEAEASTDDPNADLIGLTMETDHGTMVVVSTSQITPLYVNVETLDGSFKSVKPAGLVRLSK